MEDLELVRRDCEMKIGELREEVVAKEGLIEVRRIDDKMIELLCTEYKQESTFTLLHLYFYIFNC